MIEISILAYFGDDVHVVGSLVDIIKIDNIGVIDFLHDFDLGLNVFKIVAIGEQSLINDLDGYFFSSLNNFSLINISI